jgi:hypothetical protein
MDERLTKLNDVNKNIKIIEDEMRFLEFQQKVYTQRPHENNEINVELNKRRLRLNQLHNKRDRLYSC